MFLKFTNAVGLYDGDSLVVNMNKIISISEKKYTVGEEEDAEEKTVTVLYAGPNEFWEVKESYLEVIARVSAA